MMGCKRDPVELEFELPLEEQAKKILDEKFARHDMTLTFRLSLFQHFHSSGTLILDCFLQDESSYAERQCPKSLFINFSVRRISCL